MPSLAYLELFEYAGGLHPRLRVMPAPILRFSLQVGNTPGGGPGRLVGGALARVDPSPQPGIPLGCLATLQGALYQTVATLCADKGKASRGDFKGAALTWGPEQAIIEEAPGDNLAKSLDKWLERGQEGEVFVHLAALQGDQLQAIFQGLTAYLSQLQKALVAAPSRKTPAEIAAARRHELTQKWLTSAQVSAMLGSRAENASQMATHRRQDGEILGAWSTSDRGFRYPPWQFTEAGEPVPHLAEILKVLRGPGNMFIDSMITSGWKEVEWFLSPHVLLDGRKPADLLQAAPRRVLAIAMEQFVEESDDGGF